MPTTVELTRFRVDPSKVDALLAARPAMLADFRDDRAGFLDADLVRLPDGEWLDIVRWRTPEDFAASREKGSSSSASPFELASLHTGLSARRG